MHVEEPESQPLTLSSLLRPALSHRSAAKMTFYDDIYPFYILQRTSFIFSGSLLTIILVFLVLALSLLLILPGIRGKSVSATVLYTASTHSASESSPFIALLLLFSLQRIFWMFRIIISLFIGVVLVGEC